MPIASARWRARGFETPAPSRRAPLVRLRRCGRFSNVALKVIVGAPAPAIGIGLAPMKVFVTGGTGFIGGDVVRQLRERGDEVVCLVRSPEKGKAAGGARLRARRRRPRRRARRSAQGMEGCDARHPRRGDVRGRDPRPRSTRRCTRPTSSAPNGCSAPRWRPKIPKIVYVSTVGVFGNTDEPDRRRVLRAPRRGLHLLLRADQGRSPPDRQADDRRGPALR